MQFSTKFSLYNLTTNEYKFSFSTLNLYGLPCSSRKPIGFLAFTTFDLVNNLVGILYIIFNVFLYTVVVFLVNGKIK